MTDRELMQMALDALESSCVHDRFNVMPLLEERLAQPDREWVGLTDKEVDEADCIQNEYIGSGDYVVNGESVYEFAKAIEAKLKEKNGG